MEVGCVSGDLLRGFGERKSRAMAASVLSPSWHLQPQVVPRAPFAISNGYIYRFREYKFKKGYKPLDISNKNRIRHYFNQRYEVALCIPC